MLDSVEKGRVAVLRAGIYQGFLGFRPLCPFSFLHFLYGFQKDLCRLDTASDTGDMQGTLLFLVEHGRGGPIAEKEL